MGAPSTTTGTEIVADSNPAQDEGLTTSGVTPGDGSAPESEVPTTLFVDISQQEQESTVEPDKETLVEAAGSEPVTAFPGPPGLSLRSPVVFWTVWFLVVSTTVVVVATASSMLEKRRRTHR